MWDAIVGAFKGFFGGKAATQIGAGNKSVSGVTIGDNAGGVILGDGNTVNFSPPPPPPKVPIVQLSMALTKDPLAGFLHGISITLLNTTDRSVFVGNFLLEMVDGSTIYCPQDYFTGERQHRREVRAGDKHSFHIGDVTILEIGRPDTDFVCAVVQDAVGPSYKTDSESLRACVRDILKKKP